MNTTPLKEATDIRNEALGQIATLSVVLSDMGVPKHLREITLCASLDITDGVKLTEETLNSDIKYIEKRIEALMSAVVMVANPNAAVAYIEQANKCLASLYDATVELTALSLTLQTA